MYSQCFHNYSSLLPYIHAGIVNPSKYNSKMALFFLSLCIAILVSLCTSGVEGSHSCPYTWSRPAYHSSDNCTCGDSVRGRVECNENNREVKILLAHCMTYDNTSNETLFGSCPFFPTANITSGYVPLPKYAEDLNHAVCHTSHRAGRLCGECQPGYSPSALSYAHGCVKCDMNPAGRWIAFLICQFVPVTVFFFIVLAFKIKVTSGPFTAFVFFAQVYSSPENVRLFELLGKQASGVDTTSFLNFENFLVTIYGIWNLDFGRPYLANICLNESVTTMQTIAMEFIIPSYLIVLTAFTFIVVELHGRGFKPIVVAWKPLTACFSKFKKEWMITDSLIHTIAAFLLLSYTKLAVVSIRILNGSFLHDVYGNKVGFVPFFSTQNYYFHGEHGFFATLAIITLLTFVAIPPLILLLYPAKKCNACLDKFCCARPLHGLRTFVDSFQGAYKDGSSNRCDFRYVAGWYFLLRIFVAVGELDSIFSSHFGHQAIGIILFLTAMGFAFFKPYKNNLLNAVDALHFITLSLIYWLLLSGVYSMLLNRGSRVLGGIALLSILPFVYITVYLVCSLKYFKKLHECCKKQEEYLNDTEDDLDAQRPLHSSTFADRLEHPTEYESIGSTKPTFSYVEVEKDEEVEGDEMHSKVQLIPDGGGGLATEEEV